MQSSFAACSQVVCVAEDTAVSFYASKSLKKFRVERLNGSRVCGLHIQVVSSTRADLHVIDAEGTWFSFSLENGAPTLKHARAITLPTVAATTPSSSTAAESSTQQAAVPSENDGAAAAKVQSPQQASPEDATEASGVVVSAHFHTQQGGQLYAVLLTRVAVLEVALSSTSAPAAVVVHAFQQAISHACLSVGLTTGLIVVAAPQARVFYYSPFTGRVSAHHGQPQQNSAGRTYCPPLSHRVVNVDIQSIACSPVSSAVAIGGARGELLIFVEVQEAHCFADHWHHTPLTGLAFAVDGSAVYTGGREAMMLVWNLVSFSHKKISCHLGPLQAITPFRDAGAQLLVSCGTSTLAVVDLLQMRVTASMEGIEWAAEDVCTGLVVEQWRGQPVVMLTGMPNVLRVCDPYTQQSVYSLHVSSQMETIPSPPRHGIQFVGMLNESRSLVTYESFSSTVLPPLLRFWEYDARRKQHVETQTVYSPHRSIVLALEVDKRGRRVFTLSREAVKCWEQTAFTAQDTYGTTAGGWHNHSTIATPSQNAKTMALSADGSLCFVADDCLHVYSTKVCKPGEPWPLLRMLPQYTETSPLLQVVVAPDCRHVVAAGERQLFFWALDGAADDPTVFRVAKGRVTALCAFSDTTVVAALSDTSLVELRCSASPAAAAATGEGKQIGEIVRRVPRASRFPLRHIAPLQLNSRRLAVVDAVTGFKVLNLPAGVAESSTYEWTGETSAKPVAGGEEKEAKKGGGVTHADGVAQRQLQSFFKDMTSIQDSYENDMIAGQQGSLSTAQQMAQADKWLAEVLGEPAYAAPPMSSVLSTYLQRLS
jgi:NET1-associated nuclear protein 1 (U3 small nucleolar RNA-associated protein 17)